MVSIHTMSEPETIEEGKHLHFLLRGTWEYVSRPGISGIVLVVPITDDDQIVLVEQYRPPVDSRVIELVAGLAGDIAGQEDEDLTEAARRELIEETGYDAACIERLAAGPPCAGVCDEYLTMFRATGLTKVGPGGGDSSEDIVVHTVPVAEIHEWLAAREQDGLMIDLKIYGGLHLALRS